MDPSLASRSSGAASVHFSLAMDVYPEIRRGATELSLSLLRSESGFLLQPALECLGRGQE